MVKNYNCTQSKLEQTLTKINMGSKSNVSYKSKENMNENSPCQCTCKKKEKDLNDVENTKLFTRLLISGVSYSTPVFNQITAILFFFND